jgi:hypothetical protein
MQGTTQTGKGLLACLQVARLCSVETLYRGHNRGLTIGKVPMAHELIELCYCALWKLQSNSLCIGSERHNQELLSRDLVAIHTAMSSELVSES